MNEHSFVKAVHRKLSPDVYRWKIHDTYTGGVPDAMYAGPAGLVFVEYKYIKNLPKKHTTPIKTGLSALQIQWLERMAIYNILAVVILGSPLGSVLLTTDFRARTTLDSFKHALSVSDIATFIYDMTHSHEQRIRIPSPSAEPKAHLGAIQTRAQDHAS